MSNILERQNEIDVLELLKVLVKHIKMVVTLGFIIACVVFFICISLKPQKHFKTTLTYPTHQLELITSDPKDLFLSKKTLERYLKKPEVRVEISRWCDAKKHCRDINYPADVPSILDLHHFLESNVATQQNQFILKWQTRAEYEILQGYLDEAINQMRLKNKSILSSVKDLDPARQERLAKLNTFSNSPIMESEIVEYNSYKLLFVSVLIALILSIGFVIGYEARIVARSRLD